MRTNNINVYHKFTKMLKFGSLLAFVFYSITICIFNIFYFKYNKSELFFFPKLNFGIDIAGGKQLTAMIDVSDVIFDLKNSNYDFLKNHCRDNNFNCDIDVGDDRFIIKVRKNVTKNNITNDNLVGGFFKKKDENKVNNKREQAKQLKQVKKQFINEIRNILNMYYVEVVENNNNNLIISAKISNDNIEKVISDATDKAIVILKNRIDGIGVKEISIQRYGSDKIVILVPNGVDVERIKNIIHATAKLNFHLMDRTHIFSQKPKQLMKNHILLPSYKPENGVNIFYMVEKNYALKGDCILNAQPNIDGISNSINFRMNSIGAKKFAEITKNNIGRLLAIVLDGYVIMAPMINTQIVGGNGSITGQFSVQEVQDLSILLRSGSLPAKISIINERSLNSVFDSNMLSKVAISATISLFVVAVILYLRYSVLGMIAVLVLLLNLLFIITIISVFGFTLTLPGIAGLILTLGMATDANILIYEKIKELKKHGINDTRTIIKNSFSKSFSTILDSNVTTILAGIALFSFGGSFIKGFSVTLIIGILCSLFTAVKITKIIIERVYCKKVY